MRSLYVMDPPDSLYIIGDSTYALMLEAAGRNWPTWWCSGCSE